MTKDKQGSIIQEQTIQWQKEKMTKDKQGSIIQEQTIQWQKEKWQRTNKDL